MTIVRSPHPMTVVGRSAKGTAPASASRSSPEVRGPMPNYGELPELAAAVLQPGFVGTTAPDWVRRWLGEGLGGVALFARNVESPAQVAALTAQLRAERPDVIVAIDEEAGDVTRFESRHGSSRPGNLAPRRDRRSGADRGGRPRPGPRPGPRGHHPGLRAGHRRQQQPRQPGDRGTRVRRRARIWSPGTAARSIRGLQAAGVAACAKHFPGHGDTAVDSHHAVPVIDRSRDRLEACRAGAVPGRDRRRRAVGDDRSPAGPGLRPRSCRPP